MTIYTGCPHALKQQDIKIALARCVTPTYINKATRSSWTTLCRSSAASSKMSHKVIAFVAFLAVAQAGVISPALPVQVDKDYDSNPQYMFAYSVNDPFTGDNKNQVEGRVGDRVEGQYSLDEPDGTRRIVDYTADDANGFQATVRKTPQVKTALITPAIQVKTAAVPVVSSEVSLSGDSVITNSALPVVDAKVTNVVAPAVSSVSTAEHLSSLAKVSSVSTVQHIAPVAKVAHVETPVAHVSYVTPLSVAHVAEVAKIRTVAPVTLTKIIPQTRITEHSQSIVHGAAQHSQSIVHGAALSPYRLATYSVPVRPHYTYSVPYSYDFAPTYYNAYPYSYYEY
ncbi:cuticle protein 19.8-like isoform X2 [Diabrotica virgifera virgifera]|uniref:Cuticle protein 19.8-like isoform X2 n=1 Tax=Diabrotica virgifera virgifera TaxID=50390 RepID=A0A6P7GNI1_DIAVI|nr:cuticle protein 19.8-like isoform X2 [Diabrotica virgifera virgifera]